MRVSIMNFADGPRVVYNAENMGVEVPIGSKKTLDIANVTANFILRSMKMGDAGLVIVPSTTELPPHIATALQLLKAIEHTAYDEMLAQIQALIGREAIEPRPTRIQMRKALGNLITTFCEANMEELLDRTTPQPAIPRPDKMDGALATALGNNEPDEDKDEEEEEEENDPPKKQNKKVAPPAKSKKQVANKRKAVKAVPKSKKKARVRV